MPVTTIGSRWSSGNLIFYEKNVSQAALGNILNIGTTGVVIGSATAQDVDFTVWAGGGSDSFIIDSGASTMTLTGISGVFGSGATFGADITPTTDDGAALGTGALKWSDLFLASLSVINWDNGDITLTHGANQVLFAGGDFKIDAALGLFLRDVKLSSSATGKLVINTGGLGANIVAITGNLEVAGDLDFTGTTSGEISMDTANTGTYGLLLKDGQSDAFSIRHSASDLMVFDTTSDVVRITPPIQMGGASKINFRDTTTYIFASAVGKLQVRSENSRSDAVALICSGGGGVQIQAVSVDFNVASFLDFSTESTGSYGIRLKDAQSDAFSIYHGSNVDLMVFDTTADLVDLIVNTRIASTKFLYFGSGNASMRSQSDGKMHWIVSNNSATAITIEVGSGGSINLVSFLNLLVTTDVSSNEGDIWYDGTTNKIHFFDGVAEREVTSS